MYPTNCPELNIRKFCLKCFKNDDESTQITSFNNNNLSENLKEKSVSDGLFDYKASECFETYCPCFFRKRRQIGVMNEQQENNHTPIIPITIAPEPYKKQQSATLAHLQTTKTPNSVNSAESIKCNLSSDEQIISDDSKSLKSKASSATLKIDDLGKCSSRPQSLTNSFDENKMEEIRPKSCFVESEIDEIKIEKEIEAIRLVEPEIIELLKEIETEIEIEENVVIEPELIEIPKEQTPNKELEENEIVPEPEIPQENISSSMERLSESLQKILEPDSETPSISPNSLKANSLESLEEKDDTESLNESEPPEITTIEVFDETDGCEEIQIEEYDTGEDTETNEEIRGIEDQNSEVSEVIQPKIINEIIPPKKKAFLIRKSAPKYKALLSKTNSADLIESSYEKIKSPKEALNRCISQLESKNWEVTVTGLKLFVNLIQQHPQIIDTQIHLLSVLLAKNIQNLRSQVSRAACNASEVFFKTHSKTIEPEADDLSIPLFYKTADTNKFLRADANRSLDSMVKNLTPAKVFHIICTKGAKHQNAIVRTTSARLILNLTKNLGCDNIFNLNKDCRDKLIMTGASLLCEGSLETRKYTREFFKQLHIHPNYNKTLVEVIPPKTFRNIEKTLKSIK